MKTETESNPFNLTEIQSEIVTWAKAKGWWHPDNRNPLELLMLITTELAECAEAFRHGNPACDKVGMERFSNAEEGSRILVALELIEELRVL